MKKSGFEMQAQKYFSSAKSPSPSSRTPSVQRMDRMDCGLLAKEASPRGIMNFLMACSAPSYEKFMLYAGLLLTTVTPSSWAKSIS